MYKLLSCLSRKGVNALSGCYLISTANLAEEIGDVENVVSMPSRAVTSFLPSTTIWVNECIALCQCPLGLLPHFYLVSAAATQRPVCQKCQCPLGLLPHFYCSTPVEIGTEIKLCVNALSGCYLISTKALIAFISLVVSCVNALSGCYLISTFRRLKAKTKKWRCVNALSGCYLISTEGHQAGDVHAVWHGVNALSGCYLISTLILSYYLL